MGQDLQIPCSTSRAEVKKAPTPQFTRVPTKFNKYKEAALIVDEEEEVDGDEKEFESEAQERLWQVFTELDIDEDGYLNDLEFEAFLRSTYTPSDEEFHEFVSYFDRDSDASITWPEFQVGIKRLIPEYAAPEHEDHLRQLFDKYDEDGSGEIAEDEILMLCRDLMQIRPLVKQKAMMFFDLDKDGKISFSELEEGIARLKGKFHKLWASHRRSQTKIKQTKEALTWSVLSHRESIESKNTWVKTPKFGKRKAVLLPKIKV